MKKRNRLLSIVLMLAMLLGELPAFTISANAAEEYETVLLGAAVIGNAAMAEKDYGNMMINFKEQRTDGFHLNIGSGANYTGYGACRLDRNERISFKIVTAENEILAAMAQPGSGAEYAVHYYVKTQTDYHPAGGGCCHWGMEFGWASVYENGTQKFSQRSGQDKKEDKTVKEGWAGFDGEYKWHSFEGLSTLELVASCTARCSRCVQEECWVTLELYLRDTKAPTLKEYVFTTNGTMNVNDAGEKELLIKLGTENPEDPDLRYEDKSLTPEAQEYIDMQASFSEPVWVINPGLQKALDNAVASLVGTPEQKKLADKTALYEAAVAGLEPYETAMSSAEAALNDKSAEPDALVGAIQKFMDGCQVVVNEGERSIANSMADDVVNGNWDNLFPAEDEDMEGDDEVDTSFTPSDDLANKLKTAAEAIKTAQETAFNELDAAAREGYSSGATFHASNELEAVLTALGVTGQTELQKGVYSLYSSTIGPEQTALENAQAAYDAKKEEIDAAEEAMDAARAEYNKKLAFAQKAALSAVPEELAGVINHQLFQNTLGTGYIGMGMPRYLELYKGHRILGDKDVVMSKYAFSCEGGEDIGGSAVPALVSLCSSLSWRYSAQRGDFFGNNPIREGGGIEKTNSYGSKSLLAKLSEAGIHDEAGNPLGGLTGDKGTNIFDPAETGSATNTVVGVDAEGKPTSTAVGGFKVIVDAEPPTYTRVGNGITPDILTKVVLNENDSLDFIVSFSEATITKRGWDNNKTYLLLNNGDRAYFTKKSADGKQWYFHYQLKEADRETETTQWLVIALCNDALDGALVDIAGALEDRPNIAQHSFNADGRTITDYVGNVLADRANEDSLTNDKQIESSTSWARISVDNTPPEISFEYYDYNAILTAPTEKADEVTEDGTIDNDGVADAWGQAGKLYVGASDPQIVTPKYNPDQSDSTRPSSGIFRPDNATAAEESATTAKGLIYYVWSPDPTPPDVGTNYEVIKRYSLVGWDETAVAEMNKSGSPYASWKALYDKGLKLSTANNYSPVPPPLQLLEPENSGVWYLHVWTADMSWDSARQLMQYELMYNLKYAGGYRPGSALEKKMSLIDTQYGKVITANIETKYIEKRAKNADYTFANAWDEVKNNYSYTDAWNDVRESYFNEVYTADYLALLETFGDNKYSDDAESFARNETMKRVGEYGNTAIWSLDMFRKRDSNWTKKTAEIRFDNELPAVTVNLNEVTGDGTMKAKLPFTVSDGHSGIDPDNVYYQWVKKPLDAGDTRPESTKTVQETDWIKATLEPEAADGGEPVMTADLVAVTEIDLGGGQVYPLEDGVWYLSVKVLDLAGNETVYHAEEFVTVNSQVRASCEFSQAEEKADYYRSVTPTFHVTEVNIDKVLYAVTDSVQRPANEAFTELASCGAEDTAFDRFYQLPAALGAGRADGTWYVHVLICEATLEASEPYYFYRAYQLDNTAPVLYLSPSSNALEKEENSVIISATDLLSGIDAETLLYQWTMSETAPAENASGWQSAVSGGIVTKKITSPAEKGAWYLHVRVKDKAGNSTVKSSGAFQFNKTEPEQVAKYDGCGLITVYQENNAFYGIAKLVLETDDKAGYRYSVTTNGGETWSDWLPYSSMARLRLPIHEMDELSGLAELLQVKFRAPGGTVGEPRSVSIESVDPDNALWAVMTLESLTPRASGKPLALLVEKPEDVSIDVDSGNALSVTKDDEGDFLVTGNGIYAFTLRAGGENETFEIVVDVYDDQPPAGAVSYSSVVNGEVVYGVGIPTASNILASLETSEPVYVRRIDVLDSDGTVVSSRSGSQTYSFTENGRVRFVFRDAAGNEGEADAEVSNIDRDPPDVEIITQYSDGNGKTYTTMTTEDGKTVSQGMFLVLTKKSGGNQKNFTVVSGERSSVLEVTKNGTYSFTVQDDMGNLTVVSKEVTEIVEAIGDPVVTYELTQEWKENAKTGKPIREDKVTATISIPAPADGREIYLGKMSVPGATPLPREGDCYVLSHTYQVNGDTGFWFNDGMGGSVYANIRITGIDSATPTVAPENENTLLKLESGDEYSGDALTEALGGYKATDRDTPEEELTVTLTDELGRPMTFDDTTRGVYTVRYTVTDSAGHESFTDQTVYAISADDMFVLADDAPLMSVGNNTAILDTNEVTFTVSEKELQQMFYRGKKAYNRAMRYDVYYTGGLYREGQMKYIAEKVTGEELVNSEYRITFEKTGWYTIIIRNQERSSIYTSFFISSIKN